MILGAVARLPEAGKRRPTQSFHPNLLHFFTEAEWKRMIAADATRYGILEVIFSRVYSCGGINLSEHSSKLMCSLWLYLIGQEETIERKHAFHRYVAGQYKRLVRDREPLDYIQHLPSSASDFRRWYPRQFAAAFPGDLPIRVPGEVERGVMILDGSYRCRGGAAAPEAPLPLGGGDLGQVIKALTGMYR